MIEDFKFRKATIKDAKLLFDWANDMEVRSNAINNKSITWEKHFSWLIKKLSSGTTIIYIATINEMPFGQIRFDKYDDHFTIDYSIEQSHRGKGLGYKLLQTGIDKISYMTDNNYKYVAYVKLDNPASRRVFEKCGFSNLGTTTIDDVILNVFELQMKK